MIDAASGVEVFIKPYASKQAYLEYATVPNTHLPFLNRSARYIKAESHQRFSIVIKLPTNFDFKDTGRGIVTCSIYAGNCLNWNDRIRVSKIFKRQTTSNGPSTLEVDSLSVRGREGRRGEGYTSYGLCFGHLTFSQRQNFRNLERCAIIITVAHGEINAKPGSPIPRVAECVEPRITPKDIAVVRDRSQELHQRLLDYGPTPPNRRLQQVEGFLENGSFKSIEFTFYHLSPKFLEEEGYIGLSPAIMKHEPTQRPSALDLATRSQSKPKRKRKEIEDSCVDDVDDEEPLPEPRVKTEASLADKNGQALSATPAKPVSGVTPAAQPKTMPKQGGYIFTQPAIATPATSEHNAPHPSRKEKARKKARLLLRLEEIQAEKHLQEIRVKQQLMELGDSDEE